MLKRLLPCLLLSSVALTAHAQEPSMEQSMKKMEERMDEMKSNMSEMMKMMKDMHNGKQKMMDSCMMNDGAKKNVKSKAAKKAPASPDEHEKHHPENEEKK